MAPLPERTSTLPAAAAEKQAKELTQEREAETKAALEFVENQVCAAARPAGQEGGLGHAVTLRQALEAALLAPPLYVRGPATVTAYTAIYRPAESTVDYLWPGKRWRQSFDAFQPGSCEHDYGAP